MTRKKEGVKGGTPSTASNRIQQCSPQFSPEYPRDIHRLDKREEEEGEGGNGNCSLGRKGGQRWEKAIQTDNHQLLKVK